MAPAEADVARVVDEVLVAAEGIGLGQIGRAAGDVGECLVVAEALKGIVFGGDGLVEADVEFGFVELAYRLADVVVSESSVAGVGGGIDVDHPLADTVEEVGGDLVAVGSLRLATIRIGWNRIT